MSQDVLFEPPILVGDLKPLTRIKHSESFATITSYLLPRDGNSSVLCRTDDGQELVLTDETVVEVVE